MNGSLRPSPNARVATTQQQPTASTHACRCRQLLTRRGDSRKVECSALAPETLQDIIVGGAVFGAVGAALTWGLKKDPVPCSLCQGTGGVRCFGCGGDGKMGATASRDDLYEGPNKRDALGRTVNPRECKVCKGVGLVLCSQCKGSGFMSAV